jgi:hypothetical protein
VPAKQQGHRIPSKRRRLNKSFLLFPCFAGEEGSSIANSLLRAGFRPEAEVCGLRAVMRHRGKLLQMAGTHVQHMHKALTQMNLQIQHVIADLTGTTGLAILDAILAGERDPAQLAKLRDPRIKAKPEIIQKSLVGNWSPPKSRGSVLEVVAKSGGAAEDYSIRNQPPAAQNPIFVERTFGSTQTQNQ